jgi:hypothetical protein
MRSHFAVPGLVALLLSGCGPESPQAPDTPPPLFRAEVVTLFKGWFPLLPPPGGIFNPCTGETVIITGDFNLDVRMVTSASGRTQFRVHSQANVKGEAVGTGTEYVAVDLLNLTENAGPDGAAVFHLQYNLRSVSKGGMSNSKGWIRSHLTVNANGVERAGYDDAAFDVCQK